MKDAGEFGFYGIDLWTARKRNMLPQNAWVNTLPPLVAELYVKEFPAREPDFGNPHALKIKEAEPSETS